MNTKIKNAWAFYDWANSVYSLVISSAVFPLYFNAVTSSANHSQVEIFGITYQNTALYTYSLSFAFLIVAIISPLLSGIADYTGNKKSFMKFFCYLGSVSCAALFFFKGDNIYFGLGMSILASIGFWGSLVFYNAFLPEVAPPDEQDNLSAKGFSMGYIGASLLLIITLLMIQMPDTFGLADSGQASRLSFLMVGIWWAGFAQITFRRLPDNPYHHKPDNHYIWKGYVEIRKVLKQLKDLKSLRRFLYSFFFFSAGVQTVIYVAGIFGAEELGLESSKLILTILIIQFVAIGGAYLFSMLSRKLGNLQALKVAIVIWAAICALAYSLTKDDPSVELKFYALGAIVGLVMGGIQSLSRSTYSKMLPETESHASFFSFYDVSEKIAIVLGTVAFGWINQVTRSMNMSVLVLGLFFVIGFLLMLRVRKTRYVH